MRGDEDANPGADAGRDGSCDRTEQDAAQWIHHLGEWESCPTPESNREGHEAKRRDHGSKDDDVRNGRSINGSPAQKGDLSFRG